MIRWPNVGVLLAHRLRRWVNSKPTLTQRLMFAGKVRKCSHTSPRSAMGKLSHGQIIYFNPARQRTENLTFYLMFI